MFESTLLLGWEGGETSGCQRDGEPTACNQSAAQYWTRYGARRYGQATQGGIAAWQLLGSTIYGAGPRGGRLGPIEYVPTLRASDEELPITMQVHPELLSDPGTVAEYTWHMSSRPEQLIAAWQRDDKQQQPQINNATTQWEVYGTNSSAAAAAAATCTFGSGQKGTYLRGLVPGLKDDSFKTLAEAQAACCQTVKCGGVTKGTKDTYQPRYNSEACQSPAGETSWLKIGATTPKGCEPAPSPSVPGASANIVATAWAMLLSEKSKLAASPQYRYDLIDVGRSVLEHNFSSIASKFKAAAVEKDLSNATAHAASLLEMLDDYDSLLSSDPNFQLGPWIACEYLLASPHARSSVLPTRFADCPSIAFSLSRVAELLQGPGHGLTTRRSRTGSNSTLETKSRYGGQPVKSTIT